MTPIGWLQILIYAITIFIFVKPLGNYMFRVFEGESSLCRASSDPLSVALPALRGQSEGAAEVDRVYSCAARL